MKIELTHKKWRWALAAIILILSVICGYFTRDYWLYSRNRWLIFSVLFGLGAGSLFTVRIEVRSWWAMILEQMAIAVIGMFLLHWPIMEDRTMLTFGLVSSTCISLTILFVGFAVTASAKWFGVAWLTFCFGFGIVDAIVSQLRGSVIVLNDIFAIGTALTVVDNYTIDVTVHMGIAAAVYLAAMALVIRVREIRPQLKRLRIRLLALCCAALCAWYPLDNMENKSPFTYGGFGIMRYGIPMEFLLELDDMFIREPEGYSEERVAELTAPYLAEAASESEEKPHIIAIMIEAVSYTHLDVYKRQA